MKILLVEDDKPTCELLVNVLTAHHCVVDTAEDGQSGLELAQSYDYDLILLDIIVPKLNGISLCQKLRADGYHQPIILLTARSDNGDVIAGLDAGADEYVTKPCDPAELMARIRAVVRRSGNQIPALVLAWGDLCLDPVSANVTYAGHELSLTPKEYSLLELFLRHPQRVFGRGAIIDHLWSIAQSPSEGAVTNLIKDLRRKLKQAGLATDVIETVYGLGYRLRSEPESDGEDADSSQNQEPQNQEPLTVEPGIASVQATFQKYRETFADQIAVVEEFVLGLEQGVWQNDQYQQAQDIAHKLAGGLGTFGWDRGSELARQIEDLLRTRSHPAAQPESFSAAQVQTLSKRLADLKREMTTPPKAVGGQSFTVSPQTTQVWPLILMIDDDEMLAHRLQQNAALWGMRVEVASSPAIARHRLTDLDPDAILLDLTFPGVQENGLTFLKEMSDTMPNLPILVFTGRGSLTDRIAVSRLGGQRFLHKPIAVAQIFEAIAQVLPSPLAVQQHVMVVDDDLPVLTQIVDLLKPQGFRVQPLQDSVRFWEMLTEFRPDLLILDIEMSTFTGLDLCQVVRQDAQWGTIPILMVTAHVSTTMVQQAFAMGADDFISKPIVGSELLMRVVRQLRRKRMNDPSAFERRGSI